MKVQKLLVVLAHLICLWLISKASRRQHLLTRIVGGHRTNINKIGGFLVALRISGHFFCGGSYVASRIVVSAAHCMEHYMDSTDLLTVQGGISNLKESSPQIRVLRVLIPDKYNVLENDLDVSVLLLEGPLTNNNVRTIQLCDHDLEKGDVVSVFGWGLGNSKDKHPKFQVETIDIPVVARSSCVELFKDITQITESMLCAGIPYRKDACQYDSGGPLVHQGQLCGIVSFGINCASAYPGVYANVNYLSAWIKKTIQKLLA